MLTKQVKLAKKVEVNEKSNNNVDSRHSVSSQIPGLEVGFPWSLW